MLFAAAGRVYSLAYLGDRGLVWEPGICLLLQQLWLDGTKLMGLHISICSMRMVKKEGSQLVKIWVSAMSNNQADDPTATRRQTTQSGMLLMLTTFPLYPAHWLCWWVQPLGPYRPAPAPISCVPLNCCFSLQTLVSSSIKRNKMIDPRRLTISWASYAVRTQPVATDSTFLYRTGWEFMKFEVSWCW